MDIATSHPASIWMTCNLAESALDGGPWAIPNLRGQGVFWSEPASQNGLRKRSLFDHEGNDLPVVSVFDHFLP